jgi:iron complex outermembrane recepter protein
MESLMKHNRNPLTTAISYALGAGMVATLAMTAGPVGAQEADQDETAAELDRIQVTGTRIRRTDVETTSPVISIDRQSIERSGLQTLGDVLTDVSSTDSLGSSLITSDTNANPGNQTISMRLLGSSRTLVLVNGRRWLALGGGQVDLTQIPVAIIERVEILGDGASAIYGSDAIAGVVNVILRDDFEGGEVDFFYGENFEGDGDLRSYGLTLGQVSERGSMFMNISKTEQGAIWAGDRSISEFPDAFVPVASGSLFTTSGFLQGLTWDDASGQLVPFNDNFRYNFAPSNYLMMPSDRTNAFFRGTYDITDNVRGFAQLAYSKRQSETLIAEVPLTINVGAGPQWNIPISEDNYYNPLGQEIFQWGFRMTPLGPRINNQDFDTYFTTIGVEGDFAVGNRMFDWDLAYSRGQTNRYSTGTNFINLVRLREGVGPSFQDPETGNIVCGTPDNPQPVSDFGAVPCVPLNFFQGDGAFTDEMAEFIRGDLSQQVNAGLTEWAFNITGEIVDMPAGPLAFAAGYERRSNTFADIPDSLIAAGFNSTNFREATDGRQQAEEVYLELAIPLLSGMPGAELLELSVAARHSDFENSGFVGLDPVSASFDNTSGKIGLMYRPIDDLMIRASYSETFRAPSVADLFSGGGEGFPGASDPCRTSGIAGTPFNDLTPEQQATCPEGGSFQATSQLRGLFGGNPNALPEEGDTTVVGIVWTPSFLPGFDFSIDRWRVDLDDALATPSVGFVLNSCHIELDQDACGFIERDPNTGEVTTARSGVINFGRFRARGYDYSANYSFDMDAAGRLRVGLQGTYLDDFRSVFGDSPISEATNQVGTQPGNPRWEWRNTLTTEWMFGDWTVSWAVRHFDSVTENCSSFLVGLFDAGLTTAPSLETFCSDPVFNADGGIDFAESSNSIGSTFYHDLSVGWEAPWNASVRVGLRNALRRDPPVTFQTFANSFDDAYDIPGGQWWASYRQRF